MTYVTKMMHDELADHVLTRIAYGPIEAFYLHKKDGVVRDALTATAHLKGRALGVLLLFTPEGIVITGDLCPRACRHGCVSDFGYGLAWFASDLGEDYLASKFLDREFHADVASEWVADEIAQRDGEILKEEERVPRLALLQQEIALLERAKVALEQDEADAREVIERLLTDLHIEPEGQGIGYDRAEAGWLCAIQQRFRLLYKEVAEEEAKSPGAAKRFPDEFYIVALKHIKDVDLHLLWWKPSDGGYTAKLDDAGRYTREQIDSKRWYYNDGVTAMAVPCAEVEKLLPESRQISRGHLRALRTVRLVFSKKAPPDVCTLPEDP